MVKGAVFARFGGHRTLAGATGKVLNITKTTPFAQRATLQNYRWHYDFIMTEKKT